MAAPSYSILVVSPSPAWEEVLAQWKAASFEVTRAASPDLPLPAKADIMLVDIPTLEAALPPYLALLNQDIPTVVILPGGMKMENLPPASPTLQYCVKPLMAASLYVAISNQLNTLQKDLPLVLGDFHFFPLSRMLEYPALSAGNTLRLTEKEAAVILYLYEHKEEIVEKDRLLSAVWGYQADMDTHTVETHVYRLRQKIADYFSGATLITTHAGGYRLG